MNNQHIQMLAEACNSYLEGTMPKKVFQAMLWGFTCNILEFTPDQAKTMLDSVRTTLVTDTMRATSPKKEK